MERSFISGYKPYIARRNYPKVRCNFTLLAWANGCMYDCSYCWLKAYHPWPWNEVHVAEKASLARVLRRFCVKVRGSQLLNAGELCDSFISPDYIAFMASVLRQANEEYGRRHRLLLLTKSADPWPLLENSYRDVIVYSVSVNTETAAKQFERGAPSPAKRIHAAWRVKEAGYEVRVRVDPIIAGSNPAYKALMERVCVFIEPALITLGTLRATPRTYRFLPDSIKAQLTEKTPWGRGYPAHTRLSIYDELRDVARRHRVPVALCKEPAEVRRRLEPLSKCNCMP